MKRTPQTIAVVFVALAVVLGSTANTALPSNGPTADDELLFATVLFRHGARGAIRSYPLDPWRNGEIWPEGWGQLNGEGKRQHYELGTWLRKRYLGTVLNDPYHPDDIYILSTDTDRSMMSASINAAALFPPSTNASSDWSPPLSSVWQPVSIHSIPKLLDDRLWMKRPCERYSRLHAALVSKLQRHYARQYPHLVAHVRKHTGLTLHNFDEIVYLRDTLMVQVSANLTMPAWTRHVYPGNDAFDQMAMDFYTSETGTLALSRLKFGHLLRAILERFREKAAGELRPARQKMWVYSGHDTTLSAMLNTLGLFEVSSDCTDLCVAGNGLRHFFVTPPPPMMRCVATALSAVR